MMIDDVYAQEMAEWEKNRLSALKNRDGYLSLVGLCWLQAGENSFGSGTHNRCQFPAGLPENIGRYNVSDDAMTVTVAPGLAVMHNDQPVSQMVVLADSEPDGPTILSWGTFSWFVIKRGNALAIRIRNAESPMLQSFERVERFENDLAWRITGQFKRRAAPETVLVPTILGTEAEMVSPGTISIEVGGEERELVALKAGDESRLFVIVADGLSGVETYGGGRFLLTEPIQPDGSVVLDFNKATNPPCAFSPYATCPRPPAENRFSVDIPAGEKNFHYE